MSTTQKDTRPTKKQHELLTYIDGFIQTSGYGPSYREIMQALDYKSVSTVATHVTGLIAKGYLEKTDASARSLRVVATQAAPSNNMTWLASELKKKRAEAEKSHDKEALAALDYVAKMFGIDPATSK